MTKFKEEIKKKFIRGKKNLLQKNPYFSILNIYSMNIFYKKE